MTLGCRGEECKSREGENGHDLRHLVDGDCGYPSFQTKMLYFGFLRVDSWLLWFALKV